MFEVRPLLLVIAGVAGLLSATITAAKSNEPVDVMITPPASTGLPPTLLPAYAQRPGQMVDVGGFRLNLYCFGSGSPSVILEAGAGWGAVAWVNIQKKLAEKAQVRVCSYDRAAMNFSDLGPLGRKPGYEVGDLNALLHEAKIPEPYLLVGWSAGGVILRRYAYRYPDQVAGLITVDGSTYDFESKPEEPYYSRVLEFLTSCRDTARRKGFDADSDLFGRCAQTINPLSFVPEMQKPLSNYVRDVGVYERVLASFERIAATGAELREMRKPYGDLPLRVIVAGSHFGDAASDETSITDTAYVRNSYRLASLSTSGRMIVIPNMTHAAHLERPEEVMAVIEDVIDVARQRRAR